MALQKLFVEETEGERKPVGNSMSTEYSLLSDGLFTVFWKGHQTYQRSGVTPGTAFVVDCRGRAPRVLRLTLPQKRNDLILWLSGFPKPLRASTLTDFVKLTERRRYDLDWWGYEETSTAGHGAGWAYDLRLCNRPDCGGVSFVSAYLEGDIPKEDLKELFTKWHRCPYPWAFVEKVLRGRLGFRPNDLQAVREAWGQ